MALLHQATIIPTKQELMAAWLPTRPWYEGTTEREPVAAFRLDDPDGEVGIECLLLGHPSGGGLFVPLTYRAAPLDGVDAIATMEHSVLGTRYVYDGTRDPVCVSVLATTALTGGTQGVEEIRAADGSRRVREPAATARGTGSAAGGVRVESVAARDDAGRTLVSADGLELVVLRDLTAPVGAGETLVVTWPGGTVAVMAVTRHLPDADAEALRPS
jgi:hypothetical protein